jgi:cytolysin-activating lysine-acyltransferase
MNASADRANGAPTPPQAEKNAPPAPDAAASAPAMPELPAEELSRRAALSKRLAGAFGEIVSVLMRSETHRTQMLMDLEWLVLPALATGQFTIAGAQSKSVGYSLPVGVVLWARVSPEVDGRLASNLNQPMRLKPEEWASGDIHWLVEAVGDNRVIGPMLKGLAEREWKGKQVKVRARNEKGERVVKTIEPQKDAPPAPAEPASEPARTPAT